jgi:CubicO group peptidase (beta-lactamase class C family)
MRLIILFVFLCSLSLMINGQQPHHKPVVSNPQTAALFDTYIQQALQTWKTPGLSVAVVKDGNVVFKKAYGVREMGKQDPYKTATLSTCASTTKAMTAVCMAMLVDEGKIKWTDIVADILPEFKLSDPYTTSQITIRDLFTHNAGLGNADFLWVYGYSRFEILHRMQLIPLAYSLRSGFIYQNLMYIVAGEVILKLSGKTWDDFIMERLFKPLNMNNSFSDYSKAPANEKTGLHFKDKDTIKVISYTEDDNIGPAGGVWSCADDMSKWMQFLQDSAKVNGKRLLKPETFAELFKPQAIVSENEFYPTKALTKPHWKTYGLGWFQQDYRGKMVQFHTGSLSGLVSILGMIPEQHCSIYVFGNLDHSEIRHALMFKAFDLWCFNDTAKNWSADFYKMYKDLADSSKAKEHEAEEKRVQNTHPSLPLKSYAGKFVNELYGSTEVFNMNDSLVIRLPKKYSLNLTHWNFDTFTGQFNNWWFGKTQVQFLLNTDGAVSGFLLDSILYKKEKSG